MFSIREAIVVEGRYDKIALENVVDTEIFTTEGFGIFRDREKMDLLRRVAEARGLIVLTDSDGAGLVIRNRLRGCISPDRLLHAYVPAVPGKERRKASGSREGILGVEGMTPEILREALRRAGARPEGEEPRRKVSKADLYAAGLSGRPGSAEKRRRILRALDLPANLSSSALLDAVNSLYTREEFLAAAESGEEKDFSHNIL